uniref:Uncharacterized protein n=1 Tax=Triticum urartu TaxID=4572 RepID=A0A8R7QMW4_TRIUA
MKISQDSQPTPASPSTPNRFIVAPLQPYRLPQSMQQLAAGPIVVLAHPRFICLLLFRPSLKPTRSWWPQSTKLKRLSFIR